MDSPVRPVSPCLVVDEAVLDANIAYMAERARDFGVALRPHAKTHKTIEVAQKQLAAGAVGITCAKVSEAEVFAGAGIRDIFLAYPIIGAKQAQSLAKLAQNCRISAAFDSLFGAQRLSEAAVQAGVCLDVMLIIDSGGGRDGIVGAAEALSLAAAVAPLPGLKLAGIMTHEGHAYKGNPSEAAVVAQEVGTIMTRLADQFERAGYPLPRISSGSTPTCWLGEPGTAVNEWRPGTYVFNDAQEVFLGLSSDHCALKVQATVVSHPTSGRYILDAGSKTLSLAYHPQIGYGRIAQVPAAEIVSLSEEHAVVAAPDGSLSLGESVMVLPVHVCPAVNLHDYLWVKKADGTWRRWSVAARGCVV